MHTLIYPAFSNMCMHVRGIACLKKPKLLLVYCCDGCLGICPSEHPPFTPIPLHPQSLLPPYQLPCKWDGMSAFGSRWSEMITMAQQTSSNVCHFIATETTSRSICNERSAWWMFFSYLHSVPFLKWVLTRFMLFCIARVLMDAVWWGGLFHQFFKNSIR